MFSLNSYNGFDFIACYNRLVYGSPESYIDSCYVVSAAREVALNTSERISVGSIPSLVMSADRTDVGSSSRINEYNRYSTKGSFIFDETSQLPECPRVVAASLSLSNRCTGSDAFEIFKSNSFTSVFCFRHNILGNYMINVTMESSLPARELHKMPLSRFSSCFLEVSSEFSISFPDLINLFPAESFSIAVGSKIDNSQIHSESSNSIEFIRLWDFNNDCKIEYSITKDKISLTSPILIGILSLPLRERIETASSPFQERILWS